MSRHGILWIISLLVITIFSFLNLSFSASEQRLALLIGNSNYTHGGSLPNPVNDVRAMQKALENLGFTVMKYENCTQREMKMAMDDFGSQLKGQDVGLFFYAGHGVQVSRYNYLLPVDAELSNEKKVEYNCVRADRVLAEMESAGSRTNIVILDACRDNPFERSWRRGTEGTGLAFMNAPSGSLIAYSTAPGKTALDGRGRNSPYTAALLQHIDTPNITVLQMFQKVRSTVMDGSEYKQIPWESTSLRGDFYFASLGSSTPHVKAEKVALPPEGGASFDDILKAGQEQQQTMEKWVAWQSAREKEYAQSQEIDSNTYLKPEQKRAAWERYLTAVSDNNPFSTRDDELRKKAKERVRYWKGYKVASIPEKPEYSQPPSSTYDSQTSVKLKTSRHKIPLSEELIGVWMGVGKQYNNNSSWSIKLKISSDSYSIDYPSLNCGGKLIISSQTTEHIEFREKINYGKSDCIDNGKIVVSESGKGKLKWIWYYSNGKLGADGILTKSN